MRCLYMYTCANKNARLYPAISAFGYMANTECKYLLRVATTYTEVQHIFGCLNAFAKLAAGIVWSLAKLWHRLVVRCLTVRMM